MDRKQTLPRRRAKIVGHLLSRKSQKAIYVGSASFSGPRALIGTQLGCSVIWIKNCHFGHNITNFGNLAAWDELSTVDDSIRLAIGFGARQTRTSDAR